MKIINKSSFFIFFVLLTSFFVTELSAKTHHHKTKTYKTYKSRSSSLSFNLNLNPIPNQIEYHHVVSQPCIQTVTTTPYIAHYPTYPTPIVQQAPIVQQNVYYPGYQQHTVVRQTGYYQPMYQPMYVAPQVSYSYLSF
ncbi:MAG: hypothetical protein Q8K60_09895 [Parachlamydiaceae bacterium]|nr:hypothetical protein [Parachlamydiaceae bacterium]